MPLAVNQSGEALRLEGDRWVPADIAQNAAGERVAFDGESWVPLSASAPQQAAQEPGAIQATQLQLPAGQQPIPIPMPGSPETAMSPEQLSEAGTRVRTSIRENLPIAAGIGASFLVPGSGIPALIGQSAAGAAAAGGTSLALGASPQEAARTAAFEGGGNLVGGAIGKFVGGPIARMVFGTGADDAGRAAAGLARTEEVPLPISAISQRGGAAELIGRLPVGGELANRARVGAVSEFIDQNAQRLSGTIKAVDDVADDAATFIRNRLGSAGDLVEESFEGIRSTVGRTTRIPLQETKTSLQAAAQRIDEAKITGGLAKRIKKLASDSDSLTFSDLDSLRRELNSAKGGLRDIVVESGLVPTKGGDLIESAIVRDIGQATGVDFSETLAKANKAFSERAGLRAALGKFDSVGDPAKFVKSLVSTKSKAGLNALKELNPELHSELLAQRVKLLFDEAATPIEGAGNILDGKALRKAFAQNSQLFREVYGAETAKVLDNFISFVEKTQPSVSQLKRTSGNIMPMLGRAAAEIGGASFLPGSIVGYEAAGIFLSRALTNPNGLLFKAFEKGVTPDISALIARAGAATGQVGAAGVDRMLRPSLEAGGPTAP